MNLDNLTVRQLQLEAARVLTVWQPTIKDLGKYNKQAHHDSWAWYKAVIQAYIDEYGDLPSFSGPGKDIDV